MLVHLVFMYGSRTKAIGCVSFFNSLLVCLSAHGDHGDNYGKEHENLDCIHFDLLGDFD